MSQGWRARAGLVAGVLLLGGSGARAIPLDLTACDSLDKERSQMEAAGVLTQLHLGAEDAKALPKDKVLQVQHYVDISAQLLFRCLPPPEPVATPPAKPPARAAAAKPGPQVKRKSVFLRKKH